MSKSGPKDIFTDQKGKPLTFIIPPCDVKSELKGLIQSQGGVLTSRDQAEGVRLAVPGNVVHDDGVIDCAFIYECIDQEKLLNMDEYRIPRGRICRKRRQSIDDSDLQPSNVIIRLEPKDRKGRNKYMLEDDRRIIDYILEESAYSSVKGRKLWTDMERKEIVPGRTWQSIKDHYLKKILPEINSYGLKPYQVAKLRNTALTLDPTDYESAKPTYRGFLRPPLHSNRGSDGESTTSSKSPSKTGTTSHQTKTSSSRAVQNESKVTENTTTKLTTASTSRAISSSKYAPLEFVDESKPSSSNTAANVDSRTPKKARVVLHDISPVLEKTVANRLSNNESASRDTEQISVQADVSHTAAESHPGVKNSEENDKPSSSNTSKQTEIATVKPMLSHNTNEVYQIKSMPSTSRTRHSTANKETTRAVRAVSPFSSFASEGDWDVTALDDFDKCLMREAKLDITPMKRTDKSEVTPKDSSTPSVSFPNRNQNILENGIPVENCTIVSIKKTKNSSPSSPAKSGMSTLKSPVNVSSGPNSPRKLNKSVKQSCDSIRSRTRSGNKLQTAPDSVDECVHYANRAQKDKESGKQSNQESDLNSSVPSHTRSKSLPEQQNMDEDEPKSSRKRKRSVTAISLQSRSKSLRSHAGSVKGAVTRNSVKSRGTSDIDSSITDFPSKSSKDRTTEKMSSKDIRNFNNTRSSRKTRSKNLASVSAHSENNDENADPDQGVTSRREESTANSVGTLVTPTYVEDGEIAGPSNRNFHSNLSANSAGKRTIKAGQNALHDFLMLDTQPGQSFNIQVDELNESSEENYTEEQVDEICDVIKDLSARFSRSVPEVYSLLYYASGCMRDVIKCLSGLQDSTTSRCFWTETDDEKLKFGGDADLRHLLDKYGQQQIDTRQQYLASYMRYTDMSEHY